jgi:hypothetical protein
MRFFSKYTRLPLPKELGMSDDNALPSREFSPDVEGITWEDWDKKVKELYPIKYFLVETVANFILYNIWLPVTQPFSDLWYWLVSHLIPSRRHHMVDLRQPCSNGDIINFDCYRYGWLDTDHKMLYALFNLLNLYVARELESLYSPTKEEIEKEPHLKTQADLIAEIKAIHQWWNVERKESFIARDRLLNKWSELRKNKETRQNGEAEKVFKEMKEADQSFEDQTDAMISRLMKIRRNLWS